MIQFCSSNSLFAIPANQEFVFVNTGDPETRDILAYMTKQLIRSCTVTPSVSSSKSFVNSNAVDNFNDSEEGEHYFTTFRKSKFQWFNLQIIIFRLTHFQTVFTAAH